MNLRCWWLILIALLAPTANGPAAEVIDPSQAKADADGKVLFYDVRLLGLEGQGWPDVKAPFDRLLAKAEGKVRDAVWNLSRQSAGLCVRFVTGAPSIQARWTLTKAMPHMPATGVSGLDLYVRTKEGTVGNGSVSASRSSRPTPRRWSVACQRANASSSSICR
jgi:hypothetical protein